MPVGQGMLGGGVDLGGELGRNTLVGIDLDDPFAMAGGDAGVASRAFALPRAFDDVVGEVARDIARPVGAAVEHDDDLVGEFQARQAFGELRGFVMRDDKRRQARHGRRGGERLGDGGIGYRHAAWPSARCHKSRAALSTAATDRPSISVSVVR